jgi:hypothetical protein
MLLDRWKKKPDGDALYRGKLSSGKTPVAIRSNITRGTLAKAAGVGVRPGFRLSSDPRAGR